MSTRPAGTLLCSANFPAGAGYAWDFIERLYAGVADRLAPHGIRTVVAYPGMDRPPEPLQGSAAVGLDREFRVGGRNRTRRACELVRELGSEVLYMADRPAWHLGYAALRGAGVSSIIVHDHTSGARTPPTGPRRRMKQARQKIPGTLADRVIAVSDYVARRKIDVDLVPPNRVRRIWNSIEIDDEVTVDSSRIRAELELEAGRPMVLVACRATEYKGVHHVLRAFEALERGVGPRPALVYAGEGPALAALSALRDSMRYGGDVRLLGYRTDVPALIDAADLCVVPSVWAEAFGLAALEPMKQARPVIASRTGGLPEVVVDGETGLLVAPSDDAALADAIQTLLADPARRRKMGEAGRRRVLEHFTREGQLDQLVEEILPRFEAVAS